MEHKTYHGRPVIWSPQPRQAAFMARTEDEALYGGAAGGGKSDALVIEALRQVHIPHYRALILRKTYPQLSELIDKTMRYYKPVFPKARYNGSSHCWTFPSGAKIYFGSLNHTQDKYNYQGKAFDFIGVDELTHFTWDEYSYVMSRNRPSGPGTRVYIRATANPGGVGHGWVKARFISPAPAGTRMVQLVKVKAPDGEEITRRRTRMGVVPYGYADGFFRCLSDRCSLMTAKGPAPQRGRICMDMSMIDLTDLPGVDVGDEVEIFGPHNPVEVMAAQAGTIPYELTCAVSKRVPRVYLQNGQVTERELLLRF